MPTVPEGTESRLRTLYKPSDGRPREGRRVAGKAGGRQETREVPPVPAATPPPAASAAPATPVPSTTPDAPARTQEPSRRSRHEERRRLEARERIASRERQAPRNRPGPAPRAAAEEQGGSAEETSRWKARGRALLGFLSRTLWLSLVGAAFVAVVVPWVVPSAPDDIRLGGAVALTTLFTHGLALRSGGRSLMSGGLALVLTSVAAVSQVDILLAGATVATAVVTALLAVLATTPSAAFTGVVREVSLAAVIGVVGAFGARAWGAEVSLERTAYLAIGLSLMGALALVYRLGAGLQGLGRRGFVMIIGGVGLLTITLAYTEALAQWGPPGLIDQMDAMLASVEDAIGAVPRPIEVLLGFPALAWGVSTRARRRQGWWVCAFGAPGLSVLAVSLLDPQRTLAQEGLTILYSLVLGLLVGYLVIRADLYLTGARGRRARRLEELAAHRPEPGRFQPLL